MLTVPTGALFRNEGSWAVFLATSNRAKLVPVELGHRNDDAAEVVAGLKEGDRVILYPGDRVEDRISIVERSQ